MSYKCLETWNPKEQGSNPALDTYSPGDLEEDLNSQRLSFFIHKMEIVLL